MEKITKRPRLELRESTNKTLNKLEEQTDIDKQELHSLIMERGIHLKHYREKIKDRIVEFAKKERPRYERRKENLKVEYDIESMEWIDHTLNIKYEGDEYSIQGVSEIITINGENKRRKLCPECRTEDIKFRNMNPDDDPETHYICNECDEGFDKPDSKYRVAKEDIDHIREFATRRHNLFDYSMGKQIEIAESNMGTYKGLDKEWMEGYFRLDNGFQSCSMPFLPTSKDKINFSFSAYISDNEITLEPLCPRDRKRLVSDYSKLINEVKAFNAKADDVKPASSGSKPELIRLKGLEEVENAYVPYETFGYELQVVEAPAEEVRDFTTGKDLEGETDLCLEITNEKQIKKQMRFPKVDGYEFVRENEVSVTSLHAREEGSEQTLCEGEFSNLFVEEPEHEDGAHRNGFCDDCLEVYQDQAV